MINYFDSRPFDFLSNFYDSEIMYEGKMYLTSEHLFHSFKTIDMDEREWVRISPGPGIAKSRGRSVTMRDDWKDIRYEKMKIAVTEKFNQNPTIAHLLLDTEDEYLLEGNTWHDNIWGDCSCPRCKGIVGKNFLGKILMEVREKLRHEPLKENDIKGLSQLRAENMEWINRITNPQDLPHNYEVHYRYDPIFKTDEDITKDNYNVTHCYVAGLFAKDIEEVFRVMQGEKWSPEGEAREFIRTAGLQHTSMSVGDIIREVSTNRIWECDLIGWIEKIGLFEEKGGQDE